MATTSGGANKKLYIFVSVVFFIVGIVFFVTSAIGSGGNVALGAVFVALGSVFWRSRARSRPSGPDDWLGLFENDRMSPSETSLPKPGAL